LFLLWAWIITLILVLWLSTVGCLNKHWLSGIMHWDTNCLNKLHMVTVQGCFSDIHSVRLPFVSRTWATILCVISKIHLVHLDFWRPSVSIKMEGPSYSLHE
jgi:hypothetical protein